MTVSWNADELKVYHKNGFDITIFEIYMQEIYRGLQASCGKVHYCLGMTPEYSEKGELQVSMISYLINITKELSEELG